MLQEKYNLNSNLARLEYDKRGELRYLSGRFSNYSPAYLKSNESVADIIDELNPKNKTALSVVGSGDIPLFLSGYGARYVDVFDISVNAYIVLRMKIHMMENGFRMNSYNGVLNSLSGKRKFTKQRAWNVLQDTFQQEPDVLKYLNYMDGCGIFGAVPANPYWQMNRNEYAKIKKSVPHDYKFIWTDLYSLPKHIGRKKYDIIYLSNIVQYAGDDDVILDTVNKLRPHINKKGTIVLDALNPMYSDEYEFLNEKLDWAKTDYSEIAGTVFLKTR